MMSFSVLTTIYASSEEALALRWWLYLFDFARVFDTTKGCNIEKEITNAEFEKSFETIKAAEDYAAVVLKCFINIVKVYLEGYYNTPDYYEKAVGFQQLFIEVISNEKYTTKFYKVINEDHYTKDKFVSGSLSQGASCFRSLTEKWCKICYACLIEIVKPDTDNYIHYGKMLFIKSYNKHTSEISTLTSIHFSFDSAFNAVRGILPPKFQPLDIKSFKSFKILKRLYFKRIRIV